MDPIVETLRGKLRGHLSDGVATFKGVPYAAPPFGANRLRPPQPVEPWDGVRDALAFGPKSPQVSYPTGIAECLAELAGTGEDCLTLNIWTPALAPAVRPVMVWIPGGMFEFHATGASAFYDGSRFARDGVVCVTINYRVGAEGFLYLGDASPIWASSIRSPHLNGCRRILKPLAEILARLPSSANRPAP
jgi:carboxylesterase type B